MVVGLMSRRVYVEITELMINRNPWPRGCALTVLLIFALGLSHQLRAQEAGQALPSAAPQTQARPASDPGAVQSQPAPAASSPKDDRIFFALPNLLTVENASSLPPLTTGQKFKTVAEGCFDPVEVVFIGVEAGLGQADDTNPTYGQGLTGYSKRFGTAYTDSIIGNFGTGAIFPTLLRQDPRYYQMGKGNLFRRFGYAALRVVVTRSESSGKHQFNFSEFLGNGMAAGLSNAYHPGPHTLASNANVLGTQVFLDSLGYELKEFWPDLRRLLLRGRHKTQPTSDVLPSFVK